MKTESEIRATIMARVETLSDSCNTFHQGCVEGQIRALLWVLNGEVPHASQMDSLESILKLAGIPYVVRDDGYVEYDVAWLVAHGFTVDGIGDDAEIQSPAFVGQW